MLLPDPRSTTAQTETTPLRLVAYGSASRCRSDISKLNMVPYGSFSANYGWLNQWFAEEGVSPPALVPATTQPGYPSGYYEEEFACTPTSGIQAWYGNEMLREKDQEQKLGMQKLMKQQSALSTQITKLQKQLERLESELNSAREAEKQDAKLIQQLTTKIELLLELLEDASRVTLKK